MGCRAWATGSGRREEEEGAAQDARRSRVEAGAHGADVRSDMALLLGVHALGAVYQG